MKILATTIISIFLSFMASFSYGNAQEFDYQNLIITLAEDLCGFRTGLSYGDQNFPDLVEQYTNYSEGEICRYYEDFLIEDVSSFSEREAVQVADIYAYFSQDCNQSDLVLEFWKNQELLPVPSPDYTDVFAAVFRARSSLYRHVCGLEITLENLILHLEAAAIVRPSDWLPTFIYYKLDERGLDISSTYFQTVSEINQVSNPFNRLILNLMILNMGEHVSPNSIQYPSMEYALIAENASVLFSAQFGGIPWYGIKVEVNSPLSAVHCFKSNRLCKDPFFSKVISQISSE